MYDYLTTLRLARLGPVQLASNGRKSKCLILSNNDMAVARHLFLRFVLIPVNYKQLVEYM